MIPGITLYFGEYIHFIGVLTINILHKNMYACVCTHIICTCVFLCNIMTNYVHIHTHTRATQAMPVLISLMNDPVVQVQDTAAWTLGRICDQLPEAALHETCRDHLFNCLVTGLGKEPRVATNVCWVSARVSCPLNICSPT